ncbi:ABC transporter permease [Janibacter sp. G56]|uniref:ABC transporter permease n=1 Tax=Janibacter sp. G56 TaxID=3418717 RepID=UPI003CFF71FF
MSDVDSRIAPKAALSTEEAGALAERHGLRTLGERPPLGRYVRDMLKRRSFVWTLSAGQSQAKNQNNRLGQVWAVFNPLLLIASYFLIFGLLLETNRGVENFVAFLAIGVIFFGLTATAINSGSKAITGNTNLMRALHFPRAILPLSVVLTEFVASIPAFVLLVGVVLVTGERPSVEWLLFPVAVVLHLMSLVGLAFIGARIVNISRDLGNLIPVATRLLRYVSGVFFPIAHYASGFWGIVLGYTPFALPLTIARESLLNDPANAVHWSYWIAMAAWAVGLMAVGLVVFWWDEAKYGRG